jgi:hypothetical protein
VGEAAIWAAWTVLFGDSGAVDQVLVEIGRRGLL